MPVKGKNKGNTFERTISNLFSSRFEPITGIKTSFRRNSDSGSYFGGTNQRRKETHDLTHAHFGDIICPDNFKFSIECKSYKTGPTFTSIAKRKIPQWDEWWKQAKQDATNANKSPLLIIKYNNTKELVLVEEKIVELDMLMQYKTSYVYLLEDFTKMKDSYFFY